MYDGTPSTWLSSDLIDRKVLNYILYLFELGTNCIFSNSIEIDLYFKLLNLNHKVLYNFLCLICWSLWSGWMFSCHFPYFAWCNAYRVRIICDHRSVTEGLERSTWSFSNVSFICVCLLLANKRVHNNWLYASAAFSRPMRTSLECMIFRFWANGSANESLQLICKVSLLCLHVLKLHILQLNFGIGHASEFTPGLFYSRIICFLAPHHNTTMVF